MFSNLIRQAFRQLQEGVRALPRSPAATNASPEGAAKSLKRVALIVGALLTASVVNALPGTEDEIRSRLVPAGTLCRAGDDCGVVVAAGPAVARSGEEVYSQFCFACHDAGVGGAPKKGDAAGWEPHIAKGMDALWSTMQNGLNAMPPKGTCANCSDDELRAAMNFLVDSAK